MHRPARTFVLPVPLSRWSHHTPRRRTPQRNVGTEKSHTGYQPHRKHLRHRAPPHHPIEGLPVQQDGTRDGLQTGRGRPEKLASSRWPQPVAKTRSRCDVQQRDRGHRQSVPANPVHSLQRQSWPRHGFGAWLEAASKRLHSNVLVVTLAAKLARMAWSMLANGRDYDASWAAPHKKQGRKGRPKVRPEGTITRRGLQDGKDEWRNGSTDSSGVP
ncbi:hypothetical protein ACVWWG_001803 [Bradyrhizobium sp. LB7.2]